MNRSDERRLAAVALVACAAISATALAQAPAQPAAKPAPAAAPAGAVRAADVDPAVDTSAGRSERGASGAEAVAAPATGSRAASTAPAARPAGGAGQVDAGAQTATPRRAKGRAMDRVDLESSQITGNRELPRVLYIVPWRAPEAGDLEGRPVNSLLYELTKPVDRDVFRRENRYFDALAAQSPNADATAAEATDAGGPEK